MNTFRFSLIMVLLSTTDSLAFSDKAHIRRAMEATALVISQENGDLLGTAFCIDALGYFITDAHVVRQSAGDTLTLVLEPGGRKERKLTARVVRGGSESDLALLRSEQAVAKAFALGREESLIEGAVLRAFGPSYDENTPRDGAGLPKLGMTTGQITSLDRRAGTVGRMEIGARFKTGTIGGPLLDADGRVVGVVAPGNQDVEGRPATPVGAVRAFLSKPLLRSDFPETLPFADRTKPVRIKVILDAPGADAPPDDPTLVLDDGLGERPVTLEKTGSAYTYAGPLVSESRVKLTLTLADGTLTCFAEDASPNGTHLLSELNAYQKGEGFLTRDGRILPAKSNGGALSLFVTEKSFQIPFDAIEAFTVEPLEDVGFVRYRLVATAKGGVSTSVEGVVRFTDIPDRGETASVTSGGKSADGPLPTIPAHRPFSGVIERALPDLISDVVLAGGGRYMLLRMNKLQHLAVFDVVALEVVKLIPLPEAKTLVAGGASSFVLVFPGEQTIQRWSLKTLKSEPTRILPELGDVYRIGMGWNSEGPLIVLKASYRRELALYDLETFTPIPDTPNVEVDSSSRDGLIFRCSADGRMFSYNDLSGAVYDLSNPQITKENTSAPGYLTPGPKGRYVYTRRGAFDAKMVMVAGLEKTMTLPCTRPEYFLGAERFDTEAELSSIRLSLYVAGTSQPVILLPATPEIQVTFQSDFDGTLMIDQMVHFVPQAGILVTIPVERNRLVARYVNIDERLNELGLNYFFVDSLPVVRAAKGGSYQYQIHVKSKAPWVRYACDSGPKGMEINGNGLVSWNVPSDFEGDAPVTINIRNGDGLELRHSFTIKVLP